MSIKKLHLNYKRENYKENALDLIEVTNKFFEQPALHIYFKVLQTITGIPAPNLKQYLKKDTVLGYSFKNSRFKINTTNPIIIIKFVGYFILMLIRSRKSPPTKKSDICLFDIVDKSEVSYFDFLIQQYNVALVSTNKLSDLETFVITDKNGYQLFRTFYYTLLAYTILIPLSLTYTLLFRTDFFGLTRAVINQVLYSYTLLSQIDSSLYISWRDYNNYAILKFFINKKHARLSAVQRTRHWIGPIGSFFNFDTYYSFGIYFSDLAKKLDANITRYIETGSLVAASNHFYNQIKKNTEKSFDILFIDSPFQEWLDLERSTKERHYRVYEWILRLANENNYRVATSIRSTYPLDNDINLSFKKAGIEIFQDTNTYNLISRSKTIVTYYSTMCFEALAENVHTIFLVPTGQCEFLPSNTEIRVAKTYYEFKNKVKSIEQKSLQIVNSSEKTKEMILSSVEDEMQELRNKRRGY